MASSSGSHSSKHAIVAELDDNAIARQLLEPFDFGPPPGAE